MPEIPLIMGVLNVTPDSFSDGGDFARTESAVAHAARMVAEGADIIDVGGETTKPGAGRVPVEEEQRRIMPVIRELVGRGIRVSVDTMNASTAAAAAELGIEIVNDVSGGQADPLMARTVADLDVDFVAMHWRGPSSGMDGQARYDDVVGEVRGELTQRLAELIVTGIAPERIIVDPGLGFAKRAEHTWDVLVHLRELAPLGSRLLVGTSRKRFLSPLLEEGAGPKQRDRATAVTSALAAEAGAWAVRVHDVTSTRVMLDAWASSGDDRAPLPHRARSSYREPR
ncbi:dihydropteroate synthase [Salinibacterium sp. SYSU T00001]|uniref:dihydropteroate synthase n=1 Tax=Homoserinimonas sedimenticola TaxID=2986805 RepID=UPI00223675C4|nr:dihydropteroate synthase [Salinibacterium sedimenticola]MCW4385407.1 dihydropteroate synthase [Salinibacterium sedimenticola]